MTPRERIVQAMEEIKIELADRRKVLLANNKLLEEQRLSQRTQFDLEMMNELGYCSGIENYSRYLSGRGPGEAPPTLFDYLPADGLLVIDESHVTIPRSAGCTVVTARVKRRWWSTGSDCHQRWTTVR